MSEHEQWTVTYFETEWGVQIATATSDTEGKAKGLAYYRLCQKRPRPVDQMLCKRYIHKANRR